MSDGAKVFRAPAGTVLLTSAQHEALMAAAKELISATEYTVRRRETREVLGGLRAAGIQIEEEDEGVDEPQVGKPHPSEC